jgi:hypothetical protein
MVPFDHSLPPPDLDRPEALAKNRSTTSWPILAWNWSISPSRAASAASALPEKTQAIPWMACFFQPLISVGCRPCFAGSCARICSPRMASRANLVLNLAECRFLYPVIGLVLSSGRTKISQLFVRSGPLQIALANLVYNIKRLLFLQQTAAA